MQASEAAKKYHAIESNWGKNRKACGNSSEDESKIGKKRERERKVADAYFSMTK